VTDEAAPLLVMASDWLQLDSTDDWVRHDSEIVSSYDVLHGAIIVFRSRS